MRYGYGSVRHLIASYCLFFLTASFMIVSFWEIQPQAPESKQRRFETHALALSQLARSDHKLTVNGLTPAPASPDSICRAQHRPTEFIKLPSTRARLFGSRSKGPPGPPGPIARLL